MNTPLARYLSKTFLASNRCINALNKTRIRGYGSESAAYDGDGKTTVSILNQSNPGLYLVNSYSEQGFRLSNNLFVSGPLILFPTHIFSWNVKKGLDITADSLIVFDLIVPKVKIVIIGYGDREEPYDSKVGLMLKKKGISCEMLPTPHAVTTFNYLVADSVPVGGAFLPVRTEQVGSLQDRKLLIQEDVLEKDASYRIPDPTRDPLDWYHERLKDMSRDAGKKTFDE